MRCPLPHRDLLNGRQCAPKCRRQCAPKCPPRSRPSASNFSTPPCAIHSPSASPSAPSPTASSSPVPRFVALWALLWAGLLLLRRRLAKVRTVCAVEGRVGGPVSAIRRFLASPLRQYWPTPWLVSGPVQSAASELLLPRPSDESLIDLERVQFDMEAIARPAHVTCCPVRVPEGVVSIDWVTLRRQNARQDARQKKRETKAEMARMRKRKRSRRQRQGQRQIRTHRWPPW